MTGVTPGVTESHATHGGGHGEATLRTHAGVTEVTFPMRFGLPPLGGTRRWRGSRMARLPGISAELAAAVRKVNATYSQIPEADRPDIGGWNALDAELDAACAGDDRQRAVAAIKNWADHYLALFEAVAS